MLSMRNIFKKLFPMFLILLSFSVMFFKIWKFSWILDKADLQLEKKKAIKIHDFFLSCFQISMKSKEVMLEMNRYQLRYYKFPENITSSSKVSLNLYTTLRKLYNILKCNLSER